jgi:hypothetical protein
VLKVVSHEENWREAGCSRGNEGWRIGIDQRMRLRGIMRNCKEFVRFMVVKFSRSKVVSLVSLRSKK